MNNVKKALTVLVLLSLLVVSCVSNTSKNEVPHEQATIVGFEKYGHANGNSISKEAKEKASATRKEKYREGHVKMKVEIALI